MTAPAIPVGTTNPDAVHVWQTGDLFVFDPAQTYNPTTSIPADIDTALSADWLPAGLMLGDPGFEIKHDIDETDLNAWQIQRFRTKFRNGRVDGTCTLYEDNPVVDDILDPEGIPTAKARYLAMVLVDSDTGHVERRFTKRTANVFVENDSQADTPKGRPMRMKFYPDTAGKIFVVQKSVEA
jgi:hypothetical protein